MGERIWTIGFAVVAIAAASVLAPGGAAADDLSERVQKATTLNELQASDAELTKAIEALDAEVLRQKAAVSASQQALDSANQSLAAAEAALADGARRTEDLEGRAAERAIEQYMRPRDDVISAMLSADGFNDASRRSVILREVNGRDRDTIDELKAARIDLEARRVAALDARKLADERRAIEQAKLDQLNAARAEKDKLDKHLQERIQAYAGEDEAGAAATTNSRGTTGRASRGGGTTDDSRTSTAGMKWPSQGPLRSPFGPRWGRQHTGIDIGGKNGDPIYAVKSGRVISAGWDGSGYGNMVRIDHGGGVQSWYAHQSVVSVSVGQSVETGQRIGSVGYTGSVVPKSPAGAHLHFEIRVNGSPRNPVQYLP